MNTLLHRLVYISRNEITGDEVTQYREIEQILLSSRLNNLKFGITGALMFNNGCFAQVLEGSQQDIQLTFERIECDPRHANVSILSFQPVEMRGFPNWSMAFQGADSRAAMRFREITRNSGFIPNLLKSDDIYALLLQHLRAAEP